VLAGISDRSYRDSSANLDPALLCEGFWDSLITDAETMKEVVKYRNCFVCGNENAHGLQASFFVGDDGSVVSELVADERFQGYKDVLHGGIVASMLDEVMIKAILASGAIVVTAEMTVKYKLPARVGHKLVFIGSVTEHKGRIYQTTGIARYDSGETVAVATGVYLEAKGEFRNSLLDSID
jgi:uncharacterized protein (TIGR00369 family)